MSDSSLLELAHASLAFAGAGQVVRVELSADETLLIFRGAVADSAALLRCASPKDSVSRLERMRAELERRLGGSISVKAVGPGARQHEIEAWAAKHGFAFESHFAPAGAASFLYYVSAKRLRMAKEAVADNVQRAPRDRAVRVLIVDDSKTMRDLLTRVLGGRADVEVVGSAERPSQVESLIETLKPDVLTLDINMPEMDGVTLLGKLLAKRFIPAVMISSVSMEEGNQVLRALELGAVDYIQKPSFAELGTVAPMIIEKILTAARVRAVPRVVQALAPQTKAGALNSSLVLAIGASTGGTEAVREVLVRLPAEIPPILVVQHIPPLFSRAFAERLNSLCPFEVREAVDGDLVVPNKVLVAPGGFQMTVESGARGLCVRIKDAPPVNRHKPSVDVLFASVASVIGRRAVGVILTGMGNDGAQGLLRMREAKARTFAQDEASSVVFGMPKEAIRLGAAERVLSLGDMAAGLVEALGVRSLAA